MTVAELRKFRRQLRELVKIYRIASATPHLTATERRLILGKIKTAARRFLKTPKKLWADRLLDCLDEADANTRAVLYREIFSHDYGSNALAVMKRELVH